MVSQQLSCPCPRRLPASLLPASSLEPLQEDERVLCSFERVGVAAGGAAEDAASAAEEPNANAVGTLHVTSRRLVWLPSSECSSTSTSSLGGFQAGFASIVMHALQGGSGSGDGSNEGENKSDDGGSGAAAARVPPAAAPAVYLQLEDGEEGACDDEDDDGEAFRGTGEFDDASEEDEDEDGNLPLSSTRRPPNDLRLVPLPSCTSSSDRSPSSVAKEIFAAMCEAAAMNPTAEEGGDLGDDDDGEWFFDEREVAEGLAAAAGARAPPSLSSAGAERLARYDALLQMPRAEDLDELLDDEDDDEEGQQRFDDEEGEANGDDDDDGRFDDPEPEAATATT